RRQKLGSAGCQVAVVPRGQFPRGVGVSGQAALRITELFNGREILDTPTLCRYAQTGIYLKWRRPQTLVKTQRNLFESAFSVGDADLPGKAVMPLRNRAD